jgi:hypothetical protein
LTSWHDASWRIYCAILVKYVRKFSRFKNFCLLFSEIESILISSRNQEYLLSGIKIAAQDVRTQAKGIFSWNFKTRH